MRLLTVVVLTLALAGATACGSLGGARTAVTTTTVTTTQTVTATADASASPPPASTSTTSTSGQTSSTTTAGAPPQTVSDDRCGGSLEGCFSYDQMDDYLSAIVPMVRQYFDATYEGLPEPEIVYIPSGRIARSYCGASTSEAYEYCTGSRTIYVGQDLIWAFYRQAGDAAPAVALAHEWGHHLQSMLGVRFGGTQAGAIALENQADCVSGAWARYADEQGWLETDDDIGDVETLMRLIGSRESRARDHGTAAERAEAFNLSYEGGIDACNAYFPDSPLG